MINAAKEQFINVGSSSLREVLSDDSIGGLVSGKVVDIQCSDTTCAVSLQDGEKTFRGTIFDRSGLKVESMQGMLEEGRGGEGAAYVFGDRIVELTIEKPLGSLTRLNEPIPTAAD